MPYASGSAGNFAALRSALIALCTANGWTQSGNVLHKGDAYVELLVDAEMLRIQGGNGIDGSNALTVPAPSYARIGEVGGVGVTFPAAYEIFLHTDPDEVYLVISYNAEFWQWLAFGASDVPGVPGAGGWFGASLPAWEFSSFYLTADDSGSYGSSQAPIGLFLSTNRFNADVHNAYIAHGFEGYDWSGYDSAEDVNLATALKPAVPKYARQPNAWNSNAVLINLQVYVERPDNKQSLVADMGHARLVRVDNYAAGQVEDIGPDRWKIFPWYRKNTVVRDGGGPISHSGTFGWAIRYDGP